VKDFGRFLLGLVLTALAGWVNGVGFLEFGGLYLSFMSGNTVQFGLGIATADLLHVRRALEAMGGFAVGAFAGGLLFASAGRWAFATGLLIAAAALGLAFYLIIDTSPAAPMAVMPIAFAMGLQNHIVAKGRPDNAGTTFVTGTLFRFGDALARLIAGTERLSQVLRLFSVVMMLGAGAIGGALGALRYGALALAVPAGLFAALAVLAFLIEIIRVVRGKFAGRSERRASEPHPSV
jgi:uncharacterized membrane protein YoaK (UPF0700 family)